MKKPNWLNPLLNSFKGFSKYLYFTVTSIIVGISLIYLGFLTVNLKQQLKNEKFKTTVLVLRDSFLTDSIRAQKVRIDSLQRAISKISPPEHLKPTFEMNSVLGKMYLAIKRSGIQCAEAMLALSKHESACFTSKLSQHHNHFGLSYVNDPLVVGKVWSEGDGHYKSVFANDEDCFRYMSKWQKKKGKKLNTQTNEQFIRSLKDVNYAQDPNHGAVVMQCYKDLFLPKEELDKRTFMDKVTAYVAH